MKITFFIFSHDFMFLCCARNDFLMVFSSPNNNFFTKNHLFHPERQTVENISIWARFWSQKSPRIDFSLFLRPNRQKAPKTRFGRKSSIFGKNWCFWAAEAFILRPWRKCCSRQCFFRYSEAHFHPFRIFRSFLHFVVKK